MQFRKLLEEKDQALARVLAEKKNVQKKLEETADSRLCGICMDSEKNVAFQLCGHSCC